MSSKIKLSKDVQETMINHIKHFYATEKDEELSNLAAMLLLDFITDKLAPHFYNEGVTDSQRYMSEKIEDLFEIQK